MATNLKQLEKLLAQRGGHPSSLGGLLVYQFQTSIPNTLATIHVLGDSLFSRLITPVPAAYQNSPPFFHAVTQSLQELNLDVDNPITIYVGPSAALCGVQFSLQRWGALTPGQIDWHLNQLNLRALEAMEKFQKLIGDHSQYQVYEQEQLTDVGGAKPGAQPRRAGLML